MRKKYVVGRKVYISILTTLVILVTTVATTFAWVGVFGQATFDSFNVGIKASNLEEYGIELSLTGEDGTFSDSISSQELKRVILKNWGCSDEKISTYGVDNLFYNLNLDQCTTIPNVSTGKITSLGLFKDMYNNPTTKYFKFDIYVAVSQFYNSGTNSDYKLDVFLQDGLLKGKDNSRWIINPFTYPSDFNNPLNPLDLKENISTITGNTTITKAKVNSKSAFRVAFEKYKVVDKNHPEQYTTVCTPKSSIIYSGDTYNYPTHNTNTDVYEFGGILEDDINIAIAYYNSYESAYADTYTKSVSAIDSTADIYAGDVFTIRGVNGTNPDVLFNSSTNHLIDSLNDDEQIGVDKMMKITVSFWIEGWDADCFNVLSNSPVTLNIVMATKNEEDF